MGARTTWPLALILVAAGVSLAGQSSLSRYRVDAARYLTHVKQLASDEFGGRANGTPGLDQAARVHRRGVQEGAARRRRRSARVPAALQPRGGARGRRRRPHCPDHRPITSRSGSACTTTRCRSTAPAATGAPVAGLVFAGYGIVAPGFGYDDYAGLDVSGKAVIVLHPRTAGARRRQRLRGPGADAAQRSPPEGGAGGEPRRPPPHRRRGSASRQRSRADPRMDSEIRRSIATTFPWCEWTGRGSIACSMRSISKPLRERSTGRSARRRASSRQRRSRSSIR